MAKKKEMEGEVYYPSEQVVAQARLKDWDALAEKADKDLEGFWDEEEAEGGAKLLIGPSLNLTPQKSKLSFSLAGGPVFYATRNQVYNPDAIRELPSKAGLMIRARVIFKLSGS